MDGDRHHSVHLQISGMMWGDAAYRAMNEARRFATDENPTAATAPLLAELLDQGYVASMILAIGKLTEPFDGKQPDKGVISLSRVLADIRRHQHLITREMFVCHDGLPFDQYAAAQAYYRRNPPVSGAMHWMPTKGPEAFDRSDLAHVAFDRVTETSASERHRDDLISDQTLDDIDALLNTADVKLCRSLRNKFVAHAADAVSRRKANLEGFGITLDQLASAHRSLVMANHRLRVDILWDGSGGPVPVPQFDQFRNLERVFMPADRIGELQEWWHNHTAEREKWLK